MKLYINLDIYNACMSDKQSIYCKFSAKELTKNLIPVKSSNIDKIGIDIDKDGDIVGDLFIQFNSGDIYQYLDVPIRLYRQLVTSPSKGHFFWKYIRNRYKYRKLTGDKRGKLANAI